MKLPTASQPRHLQAKASAHHIKAKAVDFCPGCVPEYPIPIVPTDTQTDTQRRIRNGYAYVTDTRHGS